MPATLAAPIASDLLGPLDVPDEARFTFAAGLYGFADRRDFALVPAGRPGLWWLQSAEDPTLVFLLADPFPAFPDYAPDVPDAEAAQLGASLGDASGYASGYASGHASGHASRHAPMADLAVLVVVTLGRAGAPATANLQAPVLLHPGTGQGRQVVVPDASLGVQTPIAIG